VESINVTIYETGIPESKEKNESMKQPLEEEVEEEDEENPTEAEDQV
jgi:hypothetical protein